MPDYLSYTLDDGQLEPLSFEEHEEPDYWSDIDENVLLYELINGNGYQQFVFDENHHRKFSFGIPLKTVADLMLRYKSITGYDLKYYEGRLPISGQ